MTGMTTTVADRFFAAVLAGDATLAALLPGGVWRNKPPQEAAYPFGVWQYQTGDVLRTVGPVRIWSSLYYVVKVVARAATVAGDAEAAANRIDALLDLARWQAAAGTIVACTLEGEVAYPETVGGVEYEHLGGRYRLLAQGA